MKRDSLMNITMLLELSVDGSILFMWHSLNGVIFLVERWNAQLTAGGTLSFLCWVMALRHLEVATYSSPSLSSMVYFEVFFSCGDGFVLIHPLSQDPCCGPEGISLRWWLGLSSAFSDWAHWPKRGTLKGAVLLNLWPCGDSREVAPPYLS